MAGPTAGRVCGAEVFGETFRTLAVTSSPGVTSVNQSIHQSICLFVQLSRTGPLKFGENRKQAALQKKTKKRTLKKKCFLYDYRAFIAMLAAL